MTRPRTIIDLLDQLAPQVQEAFLQSVRNVQSDAQLNLMIGALERGDIEGALRLLNIERAYFAPLDQALTQAYTAGGDWAIDGIKAIAAGQGAVVVGRFDARNLRAEEYLRKNRYALVQGITADAVDGLRTRLTQNMTDGVSPRKAALDIIGRINRATGRREGGLLGLTQKQSQYADNALAQLRSGDPAQMRQYLTRTARDRRFDRTVLAAIKAEKPVSTSDATRITNRYRDILLNKRGETIARTELLRSLHAAQDEGMQQLIDNGQFGADDVVRTWDSATDKDTRDTHRSADGQQRNNDTFTIGGYPMRYPGDDQFAPAEEVINCRCRVSTSIDFSAMLKVA